MRSFVDFRPILPLLAGVFLFLTSCKIQTGRRYDAQMTVGDRTVKAVSDRVTSITFDNHNFVISFSAKKCVVERERVLYDGKVQAKIPAETASVVIEFLEGNFTVIADGQTIRAAKPPD